MSTAVPYTFCAICGGRPADPHHINTRGSGGPDESWNIMRLCRLHHRQFHDWGWHKFCLTYPRVAGAVMSARNRMGRTTESREGT